MTPTVALTIAGSDSGGGAGIQADLKTFAAHGVFGTSAITAVTAQNTRGVTGIVAIDPAFVLAQVQAVLDDLRPRAVKTGMLASGATINAVAALAERGALERLVVDPVLVSSTGHRLVDELGVDAYRTRLLPLAIVATPNLREAAVLTGRLLEDLGSVEAMVAAAEELRALGADTVVVKGGHLAQAVGAGTASATTPSPDVVVGPGGPVVLEGDRVVTGNDHGTGCSLSAAIASNLALGMATLDAVRAAKDYVHRALIGAATWRLGGGHGPIDHFGWSGPPRDQAG
ncbi:MAG TPA: bifunctional hydroxymethylpyrimidine kinase/phosphomethylpyrimidine kinase [Acidimicrobiales bacterium]|nr:bifunctional hydroxymethylpyrimidine kinase/phosphomethylpyrimidine kinase [Acidimicrobiales bacterium]